MRRRAEHQLVRAGVAMRAHHNHVAAEAFGRPCDFLVGVPDCDVEGHRAHRHPVGPNGTLCEAAQLLPRFVDHCLLVVLDCCRCRQERIFDEDDDQASIAARREKRRVRKRLARMVREIDRAEDSLEESWVGHRR